MLHGNEEMLYRGFFFVSPEDTRYDDGSLSHALTLDYGARANDKLRSIWQCRRGDEAYVSHRVEIPWLVEYYTALPTFKDQTSDSNHGDKSAHLNKLDPANDVCAKLPIELHTSIMDQLPLASIINLQRASSAARYLLTDAHFWRKSIATDLPWLWDLPDSSAECDCEMDWGTVYRQLWNASCDGHKDKILGLVNRRQDVSADSSRLL